MRLKAVQAFLGRLIDGCLLVQVSDPASKASLRLKGKRKKAAQRMVEVFEQAASNGGPLRMTCGLESVSQDICQLLSAKQPGANNCIQSEVADTRACDTAV